MAKLDVPGNVLRHSIPDGSGSMDARLATVDADGTVYWHHTDHQGSVIAASNAAGQALGPTNYSPHGEFGTGAGGVALTAPPTGSPFGYTGRQWDAKAGLYQYRARYYLPEAGIFLSMDPIGTKDDPNLYGYVANDPVNLTDPTGKQVAVERRSYAVPAFGNENIRHQYEVLINTDTGETWIARGGPVMTWLGPTLRGEVRPESQSTDTQVLRDNPGLAVTVHERVEMPELNFIDAVGTANAVVRDANQNNNAYHHLMNSNSIGSDVHEALTGDRPIARNLPGSANNAASQDVIDNTLENLTGEKRP